MILRVRLSIAVPLASYCGVPVKTHRRCMKIENTKNEHMRDLYGLRPMRRSKSGSIGCRETRGYKIEDSLDSPATILASLFAHSTNLFILWRSNANIFEHQEDGRGCFTMACLPIDELMNALAEPWSTFPFPALLEDSCLRFILLI